MSSPCLTVIASSMFVDTVASTSTVYDPVSIVNGNAKLVTEHIKTKNSPNNSFSLL